MKHGRDGDMEVKGIYMVSGDNVVTVASPVSKGDVVVYQYGERMVEITAVSDIPIYHKIAASAVRKGDTIVKYGERIGLASKDILRGEHIHTHNLVSNDQ